MNGEYRQKTKWCNKGERKQSWYVFDAQGKTLGHLASEIAKVLRGKHTPMYTPNIDTGDGVIVINARQVHVSGSKATTKEYRHYTGHMSGLKSIPYKVMMERHPERIISHAVRGMLPRNRLGRAQFKRLKVFAESEHPMEAQQPILTTI